MRPRISIRGSVRPSVRPSVHPSVRPSFHWSVWWMLLWCFCFSAFWERRFFTKVLRQFLGKGPYGDNNLWYYCMPGTLWGGRKGRGPIIVTAVVAVVENVVVTAKNSLRGPGWVSIKWQLGKLPNHNCRHDMKIRRKRTTITNNRVH